MKNPSPEHGQLLISEPFMLDPNFKRSVVLLCENHKEGAVGFIINKPIETTLQDVLPDFDSFNSQLYYGGPVEPDTLHFIHKLGNRIDDSIEIMKGVFWGGNFETLRLLIDTKQVKASDFRFFLGYSGWSTDQLKDEMSEDSWFIVEGKKDYIFNKTPKDLWKTILQDMGGDYKQMVNYPEHPSLN